MVVFALISQVRLVQGSGENGIRQREGRSKAAH